MTTTMSSTAMNSGGWSLETVNLVIEMFLFDLVGPTAMPYSKYLTRKSTSWLLLISSTSENPPESIVSLVSPHPRRWAYVHPILSNTRHSLYSLLIRFEIQLNRVPHSPRPFVSFVRPPPRKFNYPSHHHRDSSPYHTTLAEHNEPTNDASFHYNPPPVYTSSPFNTKKKKNKNKNYRADKSSGLIFNNAKV